MKYSRFQLKIGEMWKCHREVSPFDIKRNELVIVIRKSPDSHQTTGWAELYEVLNSRGSIVEIYEDYFHGDKMTPYFTRATK